MQGVEVGNTVDAEDDRFAIDDELLHPVLERGFHDPGISPGPVISVARDQPHGIAIALEAQAIAVVLDLVEPIGAVGDLRSASGDAKNQMPLTYCKDGRFCRNCESVPQPAA